MVPRRKVRSCWCMMLKAVAVQRSIDDCRMPWRRLALLMIVLCASSTFANAGVPTAPLFADNSTLEIEFELDLDALCLRPDRDECSDLPGAIIYTDDDGKRVRLDVAVRTRGRWSKRTSACEFPSLFVFFDATQTTGTLFDGETMLPFTSHCDNSNREYHAYALLEFLAYRIYNVITDASLRVRLMRIGYLDGRSKPRFWRYGFFVEHFNGIARRLDAERYEVDTLEPRYTNPNELATLSLFQFMIANLDWSVIKLHNIVLFRKIDGTVVAVPYDFDYSGIVSAEYAAPPRWARIHNVRGRVYRGFCRPEIDWQGLFARYLASRDEIMALIPAIDGLSPSEIRRTGFYLSRFWKILTSEKKRHEKIVEECRRMPGPLQVGYPVADPATG